MKTQEDLEYQELLKVAAEVTKTEFARLEKDEKILKDFELFRVSKTYVSLLFHDQAILIYLSKFLRKGVYFPLTDLEKHFFQQRDFTGVEYKTLEEYRSVFAGVLDEEVEAIYKKIIRQGHWVEVDTLKSFTEITKQLPDTEFDLRWILSGGES